jgi:IS30 family transposase
MPPAEEPGEGVLRRMERCAVHLLHKRGKSLREIASELGCTKTTIARALSEAVDRRRPRVDGSRVSIRSVSRLLSG